MSFNQKDPRWVAMRAERLTHRYESGKTVCYSCGQEMWFTDLENIPDFRFRSGDHVSKPKSRVATLDHIIPLCQSGRHHQMNIDVMCRECNEKKGGSSPELWLRLLYNKERITRRTYAKKLKRVAQLRKHLARIKLKNERQMT